jgi:hypothetical protein
MAEWETFTEGREEAGHSPETMAARELIIKDHAKYLLTDRVAYTSLPAS